MSSAAYILGTALLLHAAYSSFEHHQLSKALTLASAGLLPYDIWLEVLVGLVVFGIGALNSIENTGFLSLRSAEDNSVHTSDSRFMKHIEMKHAMRVLNKIGISEHEEFETRVPFIDIRKKRAEYAAWVAEKAD